MLTAFGSGMSSHGRKAYATMTAEKSLGGSAYRVGVTGTEDGSDFTALPAPLKKGDTAWLTI